MKSHFLCLMFAVCLGCFSTVRAEDTSTNAPISDSTDAILQHPGFREGLVLIGRIAPTEKENTQLLQIIQNLHDASWATRVEKFLNENPASPWAASLHYAYASYCHSTGRTTKALSHWEAGWELVKNDPTPAGRRLGGAILGAWTQQLSSLGRRDKLRDLIPAGDHWTFVNRQDREKFESAKSNYHLMGKYPELSFRCGTLALKAVGQVLQPTNQALQSLVDIASPTNGFSIAGLTNLAKQYGLDLIAVRRTQGQDLIVPSVIHWRQNHYAAIVERKDGNYLVNDPTFGKPKWMQKDAINEEASGVFLIPATAQNSDWQPLDQTEIQLVRGKGLPNNINDHKDKGCTTGVGGAKLCNCTGMPVWSVSEPYINLWIADEPISYLTSTGEPFTFRINFKQRGLSSDYPYGIPIALYTNNLFNPWSHSWFSYIALETTSPTGQFPTLANSDATLVLPNGGEVNFAPGQNYDPETQTMLLQTDPNSSLANEWGDTAFTSPDNGDTGLRIVHPDGSQDIYGYGSSAYIPPEYYQSQVVYMRSRHIDPAGRTTWFYYGGSSQMLEYVVDYDGMTNTLSYTFANTNGVAGFVLTQVSNPYGASAYFQYDGNLNLTNITDAAGLSSSLTYDANGDPTSLVTPYGTNRFALYVNATLASEPTTSGDGNDGILNTVDRAAQITDPLGGTHLYLYRFDSSNYMYTSFATSDVPTNTPLGTLDVGTGGTNSFCDVSFRNSFSWDARQFAALSTTNFLSFSSNDFLRGTMKHWLQDTNDLNLSGYLSVQRDPSPDGTTEGLKTFYDYQGKTYPQRAGTNALPSVTAWRLPGGETHYEYVRYDYFGNITNRVTTYTTPAGTWGTRTNRYVFADNIYTNIVLQEYYDENGNNGFFLPFSTNTFTVPDQLMQIVEANGSNAWTFSTYDVVSFTNFAIVGYEQSNQVVFTYRRVSPNYATNGVGQVTTRTYTNFDRVATVQWPAGLVTSNTYNTNGFLVQTTDLQTHRTNSFAYSNGLPAIRTNELGLVTEYTWDNLLRLTSVSFPDSTTVSNVYSALDLSAKKDRIGNWTYFAYDGLRHLTYVTNANNAVTSFSWCDCGALTGITDPLTNTTSLFYDYQSRLTNAVFPDSSSRFYQYDLAGHQTYVADGSGKSVQTAYNNQGLATNLINAYGTAAKVIFDILDRPVIVTDANSVTITNSFDMLNRLTARVWAADGLGETYVYGTNGLFAYTNRDNQATHYARDVAGREIAITNANLQMTRLAYNPANQLTNLIDGLNHTNKWNYNSYGWVTSKVDATNNTAFLYAYNANGWLTNRWMPASGNSAYAYDAVGNLTNIFYSNSLTHAVSLAYDADNRPTNMVDAVGTTAWTYTPAGQLASESDPFSTLSGVVSFGYTQGHRTSLSLSQPSGSAWSQTYAYDNAWRMTGLTAPPGNFNYSYAATASPLIQSLSLPNAAGITYQYDSLARLTNTALANYWGHVLDGYGYAYDALGLRTNITRNLGLTANQIIAGYDNIGQLTSWNAAETNGTARQNEQLEYGFDAAGNLSSRTSGAMIQTFVVDSLNQLSTVSRTGTFTLSGVTPAPVTNSLFVNGAAAQSYADLTFARTNLTLANGNNTFTSLATNVYGVVATNIFTANLPTSVSFTFDSNGNLASDGTRTLYYDAENQLTNVFVANLWKTEFVYDGLQRKRITREYTWQSGAWIKTNETRFLYDRMLVIQERDTNNNPLVTYTRGLDLSLTLQGAGGIGGLLARTDTNGSTFYHCDGSGNVTALMDENQNIVARYEYDGFGKLIGKWGAYADLNTYRFSSKEFQRNSGLYAYGFRFYEPNFQRWLNRDPLGMESDVNQYRAFANSSLQVVDRSGEDNLWNMGAGNNAPPSMTFTGSANGGSVTATYNGGGLDDPLNFAMAVMAAPGLGMVNGEINNINSAYDGYQNAVNANLDGLTRAGGAFDAVGYGIFAILPFVPESVGSVELGFAKSAASEADSLASAAANVEQPSIPPKQQPQKCQQQQARPSKIDRKAFDAQRKDYWKAEAKNNPSRYSPEDLARMAEGKAPMGSDGFPMELHHVDQTPDGDIQPMTRTDHRLGDNYSKNHP